LGLCIYKGVADIVIGWAQMLMGKQYILNGTLSGRDVMETNAPQRFGLHNIEQLKK